jgi:hypothetical protein
MIFPMPWLRLHCACETKVVGVLCQPLVDGTASARWFGARLTATVRVQVKSDTAPMIRCAWSSSEVATVARACLIAVPEVFLTSDRAESGGDLDCRTGLFGSRRHLVEGASGTGCHGVVFGGRRETVDAWVNQMLWKNLDRRINNATIASNQRHSRASVVATGTATYMNTEGGHR